jgi:hypothetical protein
MLMFSHLVKSFLEKLMFSHLVKSFLEMHELRISRRVCTIAELDRILSHFKIHFNNIFPSTCGFSKRFLLLKFSS